MLGKDLTHRAVRGVEGSRIRSIANEWFLRCAPYCKAATSPSGATFVASASKTGPSHAFASRL